MDRIYLDYAASTPVDPRVTEAMMPYFSEKFGNPGSLHSFGQEAIAAVDGARESIAKAIGADFRELVFTGSATEANNLALRGAVRAAKLNLGENIKPRIIVSAVEHESVLETARDLEKDGADVVYLGVDRNGIVDLGKLEASLDDRTVLVSVMYANNEIGTIQPIREIAKIIFDFKAGKVFPSGAALRPSGHGARRASEGAAQARVLAGDSSGSRKEKLFQALPLFHTDAVQAFQFLDCDVDKLGVDLMTLSAQKIYGPKGSGGLYVRGTGAGSAKGVCSHVSPVESCLSPLITGGGQEFGLRSGTEAVPLIVGFAKAVELVAELRENESKRVKELKEYFWHKLHSISPEAEVNGSIEEKKSLPSILNVYFPGHKSEDLLTKLDIAGVSVSSGSACMSRGIEPSYVVQALGFAEERAKSSIRFSFGRPTTKKDIDKASEVVKLSVK